MPIESQPPGHPETSWTPQTSEYALENLQSAPERVCEVTNDAYEQLEQLGVSAEHIARLAELSAKFEYGNCLEKITQIAERGGVITRGDNDREAVLLPDFYDYEERSGGQCGEIAVKVILKCTLQDGWRK